MRSKVLQDILDETPKDVKIFVRMYADILKRVHQILEEKGMSQKELAERLDKKPSEISKWLGGEHNFTLRSLAKLQAELDEEIIQVPHFHQQIFKETKIHSSMHMRVLRNTTYNPRKAFEHFERKTFGKSLSNVS
jgi:transcriptional regulator with XRE-family HTH domain